MSPPSSFLRLIVHYTFILWVFEPLEASPYLGWLHCIVYVGLIYTPWLKGQQEVNHNNLITCVCIIITILLWLNNIVLNRLQNPNAHGPYQIKLLQRSMKMKSSVVDIDLTVRTLNLLNYSTPVLPKNILNNFSLLSYRRTIYIATNSPQSFRG